MLSPGSFRHNQSKYQSQASVRLHKLNSRWNELRAQIDRDRQNRKQTIEDQLLLIEDVANKDASTLELKLKQFKQKLKEPQQLIIENKAKASKSDEEFRQSLKELQDETQDYEVVLKRELQDYSNERNRQIDDKLLEFCNVVQQSQQKYQESTNNSYNQLVNKITYLEKYITNDRQKRQQITTQLTEDIQSDLNKLHQQLGVQKKIREQAQSKIFKMIEEVHNKLNQQLRVQKQQRQSTKAALTRLLQETCRKVQINFR